MTESLIADYRVFFSVLKFERVVIITYIYYICTLVNNCLPLPIKPDLLIFILKVNKGLPNHNLTKHVEIVRYSTTFLNKNNLDLFLYCCLAGLSQMYRKTI